MRTTIEQLFWGNLNPCTRTFNHGSAYSKTVKHCTGIETKLAALLDETEQQLLEQLLADHSEIVTTTAKENFVLGFRLGARLMLEALSDDKDGETCQLE